MRFGKKAKNMMGCHQVTDFVSVRHGLLVYYYFETDYWFFFQTRIISSFRNSNHLDFKENVISQRHQSLTKEESDARGVLFDL